MPRILNEWSFAVGRTAIEQIVKGLWINRSAERKELRAFTKPPLECHSGLIIIVKQGFPFDVSDSSACTGNGAYGEHR